MEYNPFQILASIMLVASFFYIWFQQSKVRLVRIAFAIITIIAFYFVWQPELTNEIAEMLGIGRGADLIMYTWLILSVLLIVNLHLKMVLMKSRTNVLVRKIALLEVKHQAGHETGNN